MERQSALMIFYNCCFYYDAKFVESGSLVHSLLVGLPLMKIVVSPLASKGFSFSKVTSLEIKRH